MTTTPTIWAPLPQWLHQFGEPDPERPLYPSRVPERALSTPAGTHYHVSAPSQIPWAIAHWLAGRGALNADDLPPGISATPTVDYIPISKHSLHVDCTGSVAALEERSTNIIQHCGYSPETFHVGSIPIPGAAYAAIHSDILYRRMPPAVRAHREPGRKPSHYQEAMDLAVQAARLMHQDKVHQAEPLYSQAYDKAHEALQQSYADHPHDPNFSRYLIATTAGWCALRAHRTQDAFRMAHAAGRAAVDLNGSIPDSDHPDAPALLCGDPSDLMAAAAAVHAGNENYDPPQLTIDESWLGSFIGVLQQQGQIHNVPPDAISPDSLRKLRDFIVRQSARDNRITAIIDEYTQRFIDAGYSLEE